MAKPRVFVSSIIDAPLEKLWAVISDFNGLPIWLPFFIKASEIEGGKTANQVGCIRKLTTVEGIVRETLLSLDEQNHSVTYNIIEGPENLLNYQVTLVCKPITMQPEKSYIESSAFFDAPTKQELDLLIQDIRDNLFVAGFKTLNEKLISQQQQNQPLNYKSKLQFFQDNNQFLSLIQRSHYVIIYLNLKRYFILPVYQSPLTQIIQVKRIKYPVQLIIQLLIPFLLQTKFYKTQLLTFIQSATKSTYISLPVLTSLQQNSKGYQEKHIIYY